MAKLQKKERNEATPPGFAPTHKQEVDMARTGYGPKSWVKTRHAKKLILQHYAATSADVEFAGGIYARNE